MKELPRYRQVYEILRQQITNGIYTPGDLLPSENDLCGQYSLTRPTVRKALDMLSSDGFIVRHHGKGSIVKGFPKGIGILSMLGTTSAMRDTDMKTPILVKPEIREWSEAFTFPISDEEKKAGCIYFERLRVLNGIPVIMDITMIPNIGMPGFTAHNLENTSLFNMLRSKYQIVVTGGSQQLYAIGANQRIHSYFNVRQGYPIIQLNRIIETNRPDLKIYSQIYCVTKNYCLNGTF